MTVRRECPRCGKLGFVRAERVIKAGQGVTELLCGACEHTWIEDGTIVAATEVATEKEREH
jgi:hypothetical protein